MIIPHPFIKGNDISIQNSPVVSYSEFRKSGYNENFPNQILANVKSMMASSWHLPRRGLVKVRKGGLDTPGINQKKIFAHLKK